MTNNFNDMCADERGEYDCLHGNPVADNEVPEYYTGYDRQYHAEQNATANSELQLRGLK